MTASRTSNRSMIHFFGALGRADFEATAELLDPYDDYRRRSQALAAASIAADVGWR